MPVVKNILMAANRNLPAILTGMGLASMVSSTVLAVRVTPEAHRRVMDATSETTEKLRKRDILKLTYDLYIPAAATMVLGAGTIVAGGRVQAKRYGAVMALYMASEATINQYQDKILEQFGEEGSEKLRDAVANEVIKNSKDPEEGRKAIDTMPSDPDAPVKFIDGLSGRSFYSTVIDVREAVVDCNEEINKFNSVSQNSFYERLGLPSVQLGDEFGWNFDQRLEVDYRTGLDDRDIPCIYLDYRIRPSSKYYKWYKD